jgi:hypothetical protein
VMDSRQGQEIINRTEGGAVFGNLSASRDINIGMFL